MAGRKGEVPLCMAGRKGEVPLCMAGRKAVVPLRMAGRKAEVPLRILLSDLGDGFDDKPQRALIAELATIVVREKCSEINLLVRST